MPVLKNARHERFAQELAKGSSAREAYLAAGYETKGDAATDAAASRLLSDVKVARRVDEILGKAAVRAEITVANITERLLAIAAKGEKSNDAPKLSVARAALMDAAKLNGLVIEKAESTVNLTPMPTIIEFVAPDAGDD